MNRCLLVVAFPAEARPLIEHFKLRLQHQKPFRTYTGDAVTLVETGIGKLNAAAATAAALQQLNASGSIVVCLNVGIAGAELPLGSLVAAHRVIDRSTRQFWHPQLTGMSVERTAVIETVDRPDLQYREGTAFDMEAAGFMTAATRYATLEFTHSLKVISDNSQHSPDELTHERVYDLIVPHLDTLQHCAEQLCELAGTQPDRHLINVTTDEFARQFHLSAAQRHTLGDLLTRHAALHGSMPAIPGHADSKQLLRDLKGALDSVRQVY